MTKVVKLDGMSPNLLTKKLEELLELGCEIKHIHAINKTLYIVIYEVPEQGA